MLSYRGYGLSSGSPSEQGLKQDAQVAFEYLRNKKKSKHIILYGQSLGGAVALHLATKASPHAVILENTFLSIVSLPLITLTDHTH